MEKFFSVSVEFNDGTTKSVAARGESHGSVFQQIKQMPGIRRVGKVTEVTPGVQSAQHGRPSAAQREPRREYQPLGSSAINPPLRGPRVVLDARRIGGEQPFKHLQAPPERPKPAPQPVVQVSQPKRPEPELQSPPASPAKGEPTRLESPESESTELEYRIVRSRRAGGHPYLLQRGTWSQRDGKRIFNLDWEKGFEERAKAELHLQWVQQSEQELDAVDEETEDESQLTPELAEV